jgi:hypothetical protein
VQNGDPAPGLTDVVEQGRLQEMLVICAVPEKRSQHLDAVPLVSGLHPIEELEFPRSEVMLHQCPIVGTHLSRKVLQTLPDPVRSPHGYIPIISRTMK